MNLIILIMKENSLYFQQCLYYVDDMHLLLYRTIQGLVHTFVHYYKRYKRSLMLKKTTCYMKSQGV